jgi:tellurite resistance protein
LDGVVHEPEAFFQVELRSPVPRWSSSKGIPSPQPRRAADPTTPSVCPERPGTAQRRAARDGLRVLAALARSDGLMHPAEVEVILDYIAERANRDGIATGAEDRAALAAYVKRQRPGADTLDECLARLARAPADEPALFLRSALELAEADGQRDTAEMAMLFGLQRQLAAA